MQAQSGVGIACRLAVESARRTTIVFDSRRVIVAEHCMMEDRVNHCSS